MTTENTMTYLQEMYEKTQQWRAQNGYDLYTLDCDVLNIEIPRGISLLHVAPGHSTFRPLFQRDSDVHDMMLVSFESAGFTVEVFDERTDEDVEHTFSYSYDDFLYSLALDENSPFHLLARDLMLFYPEAVGSLLGCPDDEATVRSLIREYPSQVRSMLGWA